MLDMVEHCMSFDSYNHFVETIRNDHTDYNCKCSIIENLNLNRTKIRTEILNVFYRAIPTKVVNILRHIYFLY